MLVVGFEGPEFKGEILEELTRLKDEDIIRLIDLVVVKKDDEGNIETLHTSDLSDDEAMEFGARARHERVRADLEDTGHPRIIPRWDGGAARAASSRYAGRSRATAV